ncbi:MAG: hypothetical protein HZA54_18910 [Planctomycetes bacterium]|nr:hypothetical protein [Planctomycetota bacterium]
MKRTILGLAVAVGLLTGGGAVRAEDKVMLKENLKANDVFTVTTSFEMTMAIHGIVGPQEFDQNVMHRREEVMGTKVLAVENGRVSKLRRHIVSQKETEQNPGMAGPETKDGEDAGRIYVITGFGKGRKVECLNDAPTETELKKIKNNPQTMILPGKAVAVGEIWEVPADVLKEMFFDEEGERPEKMSMKCKLLGTEEVKGVKCARVGVELYISSKQDTGMVLAIEVAGEGRFALDSGAFLGWELSGKTTMTGEQEQGGQKITMKGEGPLKMRESWEPGKADLGDESKKLAPKPQVGEVGGGEEEEEEEEEGGGMGGGK